MCNGYTNHSTFLIDLYSRNVRALADAKKELLKNKATREQMLSYLHKVARQVKTNESLYKASDVDFEQLIQHLTVQTGEQTYVYSRKNL